MTNKIDDIKRQMAELAAALEEETAKVKETATSKIQKIMSDAGLTNDDLALIFPPTPPVEPIGTFKNSRMKSVGSNTRKSPAITHQDPSNPENVWRSRGLKPRWLQHYLNEGRKLEEFAV